MGEAIFSAIFRPSSIQRSSGDYCSLQGKHRFDKLYHPRVVDPHYRNPSGKRSRGKYSRVHVVSVQARIQDFGQGGPAEF